MEQSSPVKKDTNNFNNKPTLNSELLFFKNEILGDLKHLENKFLKKIEQNSEASDKKILQLESSIDSLTKKLFTVSNFFSENATMKDRVDNLFQSRTKIEETLYSHEYKLSSIGKDLVTAINKYDRIIEKSIYYPGLIGANNAKFNTFHNFIDYIMMNLSQLNHFKDKTMGLDLKQYKNRLEATIEGFKKQTEEIITNNKTYTSKLIKNLDNKFKNDFELYDQRLFNLKIKNTEQVMGIEKLTKNILNELSSIKDMKKNIEKNYESSIQLLRLHYVYAENRMNQCIKDYDDIKKRMDLLLEALKGFKGGNNPNLPDIMKQMANLVENQKENIKKAKAESLLKKYIVGQMDLEQIAQLTKKTSGKVNFNDKNDIIKNIFEDNINSNNIDRKTRMNIKNTRSFIKYDSSKISLNRDNYNSENKNKRNNLFSSQRIVFSKRPKGLERQLSESINVKNEKINNSEVNDKNRTFTRMQTTVFNEKALSKLNEKNSSPSQGKQLLVLKSTKNLTIEKISLNNDSQPNSFLWGKGQKNNILGNKPVSIIKESMSEYKQNENEEKFEDLKEEQKLKKKVENDIKNIEIKEKGSDLKNINSKNKKLDENDNITNELTEKIEKNKEDINELKKSLKSNNKEESEIKEDEISDLDKKTILSTVSEHNILTPKRESDKEKSGDQINISKNIKENNNTNIDTNLDKKKYKENQINIQINKELKDEETGIEKEKVFGNKENNDNLRLLNFGYRSRNEDNANIKNIHLPIENTFPEENGENNFYLEIMNKTQEKNSLNKLSENLPINSPSKIGLQKLLKGDRNALNSFKYINNINNTKMRKSPNSEYETRRNNFKNTHNIITTKPKEIKSATSINFYNNNNINQNNKDKKFGSIIENLFENNLEDFFNDFVGNTDVNSFSPLLPGIYQEDKNKKNKVNIVHIPAISHSQRNIKKEYSRDALKRIEALRKIKYENNENIYNKNKMNRSNENVMDNMFGRTKLSKKIMKAFEGFNM